MCKAFSCVVEKSGKVFWKAGLDSHEDIKKHYKIKDTNTNRVGIEITPKEGYLHPESEWKLRFDNSSEKAPEWWKSSHDKHCFDALKAWKKEVYDKININEVINPVNPLLLTAPKVTKKHIKILKEWASVRASVRASVWDSVWDSVRASVGASVWDSVWDSVRASVWDSVGDSVRASVWDSVGDSVRAYTGSLIKLQRDEWKYTKKIKTKNYPFESVVKLWRIGFITSFDGKIWRLYAGKGKEAKVVFEITKEELRKME